MLCLFTLFSKLYSLHPNIYYRAKKDWVLKFWERGDIIKFKKKNCIYSIRQRSRPNQKLIWPAFFVKYRPVLN
mgnify:CR=1 FL=1